MAERYEITTSVADATGRPVAGASVLVEDLAGNPLVLYDSETGSGTLPNPASSAGGNIDGPTSGGVWVEAPDYDLTITYGSQTRVERIRTSPPHVFHPKSYGAVAGGTNDNAAALTAAINAAEALGNGEVPIDDDYGVASGLTVDADGVSLVGRGGRIRALGTLPLDTFLVTCLGRQRCNVTGVRLSCAARANGIWQSGPTTGNPHNLAQSNFIENVYRVGIRLGVDGTASFSGKAIDNTIQCEDNAISIGIESNNSDNTITDNKATGYCIAALKNNVGVAKSRNNEWGPGKVRTTGPYPNAVLVTGGGIHSVDDYYDTNKQNHPILIQPSAGRTVVEVKVADAKGEHDSLQGDGVSAADGTYSWIRLDDTNGSISRVLVADNTSEGVSFSRRLQYVVDNNATVTDVTILGNRLDHVQAIVKNPVRGRVAGSRVKTGSSTFVESYQDDWAQAGEYVVPPIALSTSTLTLVANQARYVRYVPARSFVAAHIVFAVSTAAGSDDAMSAGIYDATGARIATSGAVTGKLNSLGVKTADLLAVVTLQRGQVYYVALSCGAVGSTAAVTNAILGAANTSSLFGAISPQVEIGSQSTAHPLPATATITAAGAAPLMAVTE